MKNKEAKMSYKKSTNFLVSYSITSQSSDVNRQCTDNQKQKSEENRQKSQCRFCNSTNLIIKPALAKGYEKIICSDCGRFQKLVKPAIASNKNQEVEA